MNELSAPRPTQVSGTGDYEVISCVRATCSARSGSTRLRISQGEAATLVECELGLLRSLEKAYTVSSRTTVVFIQLEIDRLYAGFFAPDEFYGYR